MEYTTFPGKTYIVTSPNGGAVYDSDGRTLATFSANEQKAFVATTGSITVSDTAAVVTEVFKGAPALGGGGGSYTLTAEAVKEVVPLGWNDTGVSFGVNAKGHLINSVRIGSGAMSYWEDVVAVGCRAAGSEKSVAVGMIARATQIGCVALGYYAAASTDYAQAYGRSAKAADYGVVVHRSTAEDGTVTQLYFSGANTPLATTYEGGAPMLGYTVTDSAGNVTAAGTRSLLDLLTNNSTFAPATTDENGDWVLPTVFHPSDLDLPAEEVTEPTEEAYTPLPVYPIVEPEIDELTD